MISANIFYKTNAGMLSTALCGWLAFKFNTINNPVMLGKILVGIMGVSFAGSIPFFYLGGRAYQRFVNQRNQEQQNPGSRTPAPRMAS